MLHRVSFHDGCDGAPPSFDLCHTLGMHRKSLYSMSTFVILFTGVMCTYKEMEIER